MITTYSMAYEELLEDARAVFSAPWQYGYAVMQVLCPLVCHAAIEGFAAFYEPDQELHPSPPQRAEATVLAAALEARLRLWHAAGQNHGAVWSIEGAQPEPPPAYGHAA